MDFPPGAIKSLEEAFALKGNKPHFHVYLPARDSMHLRTINSAGIFQGLTRYEIFDGSNATPYFNIKNDLFLFTNYWLAYGYLRKLNPYTVMERCEECYTLAKYYYKDAPL